MHYLRFMLLLCAMSVATLSASAQKKESKNNKPRNLKKTMFEGTIKEKPWTKSSQSYCAQGSEYFVLVQKNGEEIVLQNASSQDLASFKDKAVTITGKIETKTIKPSSNPMEQKPVMTMPDGKTTTEADFTCTILVVTAIK